MVYSILSHGVPVHERAWHTEVVLNCVSDDVVMGFLRSCKAVGVFLLHLSGLSGMFFFNDTCFSSLETLNSLS